MASPPPFFCWSGDSIVTGSSAGEFFICPLERLWNLPPGASGTSTSAGFGEQSQPKERNTNILQNYSEIFVQSYLLIQVLCFCGIAPCFRQLLRILAHLAPGHWSCPRSCRSTGPKYLQTARSRRRCRWCASPQRPGTCDAAMPYERPLDETRWNRVKSQWNLDLKEMIGWWKSNFRYMEWLDMAGDHSINTRKFKA